MKTLKKELLTFREQIFEFSDILKLEDLINRVAMLGHGLESIYLEKNHGWDNTDIYLVWSRFETDEEFEERKQQVVKEQARQKAATAKQRQEKIDDERKLYEKLKKKFEK